ncbi:MAG: twin-arginine translocation signal domain-containing protein, partial [Calditrichales bacterium]
MDRRKFLKTSGSLAVLSAAAAKSAYSFVPAHNWEKHDFGPGPAVPDRLNQGPFPIYAPEEVIPGSNVVMATTPSKN